MNYTLIGSLTSPYVRKLRLLLHNLAPYELKVVNYLEKEGNDYLSSINPINKLPVLIDGEKTIFDSRVIYNYLAKKHNLKALTVEEENIISIVDAGAETSVNLFSLKRGGLDLNSGNAYIERQKERVGLILNYLENWATKPENQNPNNWNFVTMSAYSYLYWAGFREMIDLSGKPALLNFLECFKNAPGVLETNIPT